MEGSLQDEEGKNVPVTSKADFDSYVQTINKDVEKQNNEDQKDKTKTKEATERVSLFELFSAAEPIDILFMTLGVIGGIITGLSLPFFNVLFGRILDKLNQNPNSFDEGIKQICLAFVGVAAFNLLSGYLQVTLWSIAGERQTQKLREMYVRSVLAQEIGWFDTAGATELSTKVADIMGKIEDGMGRKIGDMIQYISQIIGSFIVGFYLCWKLTVVLLASFPIIAVAGAFMISATSAAQQQALEQYAKAGGLATEALSAIRTVTALNAQVDIINRYRVFLLDAMQIGIRKGLNVGIGNGLVFGACFCTYALGFWYGGKLVADDLASGCDSNCLTGGTILAVFFSVLMGSLAMGQVAPPLTAITSALAAAVPLFKVINRKPLIDGLSNEGVKPDKKLEGNISLKNIEFSYPARPDIKVCKGYSLDIKKGETIALVGPSGCGKSTIINLLLRFYDPQEGAVMVDGIDIKTLNTRWLRSQMGYVGQEPVLFSGSIADNIAYGIDREVMGSQYDDGNIRAAVERAAKLSNAHEFISSFPDGYDTDVGSNGIALSGGQKQRIAIARALIRQPAILLLDEATSALDAASERLVQESIDMLQSNKNQTTIIIAHRLSTIRNADHIAVINQGQVVELGKHDELLELNGLYADLVQLQMSTGQDAEIMASNRNALMSTSISNTSLENVGEDTAEKAEKVIVHSEKAGNTDDNAATENVTVTEESLTKEETKKLKGRIWGLVYENKGWFTLCVLGGATFGAIFPLWGLLLAKTQHMFYYTDPQRIRDQAATLSILYIVIAIVAVISSCFQFWGMGHVGERISARLRSDLFEALMRREISFFDYEENNTGSLTTRLADDSRTVHKATGEAFAKQIQALFTLAIGIGIGFSASWKIAFVVIACFPINIAASAIQMQAIAGQQYDHDDSVDAKKDKKGKSKDKKSKSNEKDETKEPETKSVGGAGHGAIISTAFTHMRTVSAFSMQFHVANEYSKLTNAIAVSRMNRSHVAGLGFGGAQLSLFCTYALLFWYGSKLIKSGEIRFEQLMTAILSLMLGALGLGQALVDMADQKSGLFAAKRIFDAIEQGKNSPIDGLSDEGTIPEERSRGAIELRGVHFKYPTRPKVTVCKDYHLSIEPGEVVALVGPSGSGKSTIMSLLLRFYDPLRGEVLLDAGDVQNVNVKWLRSQIGYVGQEPVLFSGTIAENIAKGRPIQRDSEQSTLMSLTEAMRRSDAETGMFGKSASSLKKEASKQDETAKNDADDGDVEIGVTQAYASRQDMIKYQSLREGKALNIDADIIEAAKLANAHDFIKTFPNGYHTDVGEGSIMVSGGQKQRIAIARALIRKPAVLLLDEATSALDSTSEKMVQESIDMLTEQKTQTTIIIAHRLSTIRNADKIAVIQHGQVVELGKHEELLAKDGVYATLWAKQGGDKTISPSTSANHL